MRVIADIAMVGWVPAIVLLFSVLPARKAIIAALVFGWLFLPDASYDIPYLPAYDKLLATSLGVFAATLLWYPERVLAFRPSWVDLPVAVLSFSPFLTSLRNGLGAYDGASTALTEIVSWMLPYWLGRIYFAQASHIKDLLFGIFLGGLTYVPLCLWEVRMSPQLHRIIYGFTTTQFAQVIRYGGYRPVVFLGGSGMLLALFMGIATLCSYWLWRTKAMLTFFGIPMYFFTGALLVTTVLTKSTLAIMLTLMGFLVLEAVYWMRSRLPLYALGAAALLFVAVRATGLWSGEVLVELSAQAFGRDRAESLEMRIVNDTILAQWAWHRPFLGWGGYGRNRPPGIETIVDSRWILLFGTYGLVALTAWMATVLLPVFLLPWRSPPPTWRRPLPGLLPLAALILLLGLLDNLLNADVFPLYVVLAGGLAGLEPMPGYAAAAAPRPRGNGLPPRNATRTHSQAGSSSASHRERVRRRRERLKKRGISRGVPSPSDKQGF